MSSEQAATKATEAEPTVKEDVNCSTGIDNSGDAKAVKPKTTIAVVDVVVAAKVGESTSVKEEKVVENKNEDSLAEAAKTEVKKVEAAKEKEENPEVKEEKVEVNESKDAEEKVEGDASKDDKEEKVEVDANKDVEEEKMDVDASKDVEEEEEENVDEDSEDSDSDEELPLGTLERPVEILNGKRVRKKLLPFSCKDTSSPAKKVEKVEVNTQGKGLVLSEHPMIVYQVNKCLTDDLKIVYRLFYGGRFPSRVVIKKGIRDFSGFLFEKDTKEYTDKKKFLLKFTLANLKWTISVLDCVVVGTKNKENLVNSILEWCLCPQPSGKEPKNNKKGATDKKKAKKTSKAPVAAKAQEAGSASLAKTPAKKTPAKKTPAKKTPAKKTPVKKAPLKKDVVSTSTTSSKAIENSKGSVKAAVKKGTPVMKKKAETDASASSPAPSASGAKAAAAAKTAVKRKASITGGKSPAQTPKQKKAKTAEPPTDEDLRKCIEDLLDGADLEKTTMKTVCVQVYQQFPDHELSLRKSFIKDIVKEVIARS